MTNRPWTKEQCRDRYVRGDRITLQQLAVESGNPYKTLNHWSRFDEPKWSIQRQDFQAQLRLDCDKKVLEEISTHTSDLAVEHLKSYQSARSVVDVYFRWQSKRLDEVKSIPERLEAELKSIRAANINFWMLSLERAISGERLAAGLEWENVPKAIAFLEKLGYQIIDPSLPSEADAETSGSIAPKGLSDEVAAQVWAGILGVEENPGAARLPEALGDRSGASQDSREVQADRV